MVKHHKLLRSEKKRLHLVQSFYFYIIDKNVKIFYNEYVNYDLEMKKGCE